MKEKVEEKNVASIRPSQEDDRELQSHYFLPLFVLCLFLLLLVVVGVAHPIRRSHVTQKNEKIVCCQLFIAHFQTIIKIVLHNDAIQLVSIINEKSPKGKMFSRTKNPNREMSIFNRVGE